MIDILGRGTGLPVYHSEAARTIEEAVLEGVKSGARLSRADLRGASLYGADLRGASLYGASLYAVNLGGADLRGASLYGADLRDATLSGADLRGASLRGASLRGADLRGADFRGAYLYGATGADLRDANLDDANLYGVSLLPDGIKPLQIAIHPYWLIVREPGIITIACEHHPVTWWWEHATETAEREHLTQEQLGLYRFHFERAIDWMKKRGIVTTR